MPITNFLKSLFKSDGQGAGAGRNAKRKRVAQLLETEKEMVLEQLQNYLGNVQLRIEVLEFYLARYNDVDKDPWIPEYRMNQANLRLIRLRSDADKLKARISILKSVDCGL